MRLQLRIGHGKGNQMRNFVRYVVVASLAVIILGCGSATHTESAKQAEKASDTKVCSVQAGGHDVLRLTVPSDASCKPTEGSVVVNSNNRTVEFWLVDGAKTVDEALGKVSEQIKSEFTNFKVTKSTDLTVADAPAKRQEGSGEEADDGDDGKADVIVFKVGDHIFVACTHGEALNAAAQEWMLTLVQSAKGA
jgi:hypothetical protein